MKHRIPRLIILFVLFSFLWGAWWGFYSHEKERVGGVFSREIHILSWQGFLSSQLLTVLEKKTNAKVILTEISAPLQLLQEILTHKNKYDLIFLPSFLGGSLIPSQNFRAIPDAFLKKREGKEVDFRSFDFDPESRFLYPVAWRLNGFLLKKNKSQSDVLATWINQKFKGSFDANSSELFRLFTELRPILKSYVETGQEEPLISEISQMALKSFGFHESHQYTRVRDFDFWATNHVVACLNAKSFPDYTFLLPQEKGGLWIMMVGLGGKIGGRDLADDALKVVTDLAFQIGIAENSSWATVSDSMLMEQNVPECQKPQYIRTFSLSKVNFFFDRNAFDPAWLKIVTDAKGGQ
jgi:hypothetical protein